MTWSGGLDTTVLVAMVCEKYSCESYPIFVNRGQRNLERERESVRYFTEYFSKTYAGKFHEPIEVAVNIPPREFKESFPDAEWARLYALRNSDLTNQGVRYAELIDCHIVAVGSTQDDAWGDDKPKFWTAKNEEVRAGTKDNDFWVIALFQQLRWMKSEITAWGMTNKLPLEKTWSCWEGGEEQCGVCAACVDRRKAFREAKCGSDPTRYSR